MKRKQKPEVNDFHLGEKALNIWFNIGAKGVIEVLRVADILRLLEASNMVHSFYAGSTVDDTAVIIEWQDSPLGPEDVGNERDHKIVQGLREFFEDCGYDGVQRMVEYMVAHEEIISGSGRPIISRDNARERISQAMADSTMARAISKPIIHNI